MSVWIQALKIFNKDGMWCMPRKGTPEHAAVKKIMDRLKSADQKRIVDESPNKVKRKLRTEKEKKEASLMAMEDRDAPEMKKPKPVVVAVAVKKPKKTKKKKVQEEDEGYGTDETRPEPLPDIYIGEVPKNIRNNIEEKKKWLKNEYLRQYNMLALKTKIKELEQDYIFSSGMSNYGFENLKLIREELEKLMKENPKSAKKIKKIIEEGRKNEERNMKK